MKVAILLRGITFELEHTTSEGVKQSVDWRLTRENLSKQVIKQYPDADIYLASYRSKQESELVDYFEPSAYIFHRLSPGGVGELDCLLSGLSLIEKSCIKYDLILISRFDLHFYEPILTINFDYSKVNFLYREFNEASFTMQGKCANAVWCLPLRHLSNFITACQIVNSYTPQMLSSLSFQDGGFTVEINIRQRTHYIYHELKNIVSPEEIHFTRQGYFGSKGSRHVCPYYKIIRSPDDVPEISESRVFLFGSLLQNIRAHENITREYLSSRSGIAIQRLKKIESGDCDVTLLEFLLLAEALSSEPWKMLKFVTDQDSVF